MTDEIEEVSAAPSPGQLLSQAREQLGTSTSDIAESMNLKAHVIEAIDADDLEALPNATFVRGYLKAYARAVGCDQEQVLAAHDYIAGKAEEADMQSFSRRTSRERSNSRIMWITYFIALVLAVSVIFWWWQKFQAQSEVTLPEVQIEEVEESIEQTPNVESVEERIEPVQETVQPQPEQKQEQSRSEESAIVENLPAEEQTESKAIATEMPELSVEPTPAQQSSTVAPISTQVLHQISLTFSEDCWIKVTDATGETVAEGTKTPARVVSFSGVPPFTAILGAPAAVTVEYQGEPMPFQVTDPSRALTLTLPVTE